jgi:hypothetical protein
MIVGVGHKTEEFVAANCSVGFAVDGVLESEPLSMFFTAFAGDAIRGRD